MLQCRGPAGNVVFVEEGGVDWLSGERGDHEFAVVGQVQREVGKCWTGSMEVWEKIEGEVVVVI